MVVLDYDATFTPGVGEIEWNNRLYNCRAGPCNQYVSCNSITGDKSQCQKCSCMGQLAGNHCYNGSTNASGFSCPPGDTTRTVNKLAFQDSNGNLNRIPNASMSCSQALNIIAQYGSTYSNHIHNAAQVETQCSTNSQINCCVNGPGSTSNTCGDYYGSPDSVECPAVMASYCTAANMTTDQCQTYYTNLPKNLSNNLNNFFEYCVNNNEFSNQSSFCYTTLAQYNAEVNGDSRMDEKLTQYCFDNGINASNINQQTDAAFKEICACQLGTEYYTKFITDLKTKYPNLNVASLGNPRCLVPNGCAGSAFKNVELQSQPQHGCQGIQCLQIASYDFANSNVGNVTTNQDASCSGYNDQINPSTSSSSSSSSSSSNSTNTLKFFTNRILYIVLFVIFAIIFGGIIFWMVNPKK